MESLAPRPPSGRTFQVRYRIRLSDTDATGRLRLDAVARFLQDAAIDDVEETGWGAPDHLWVLRSVRIDVVRPFLADTSLAVETWGSSFSSLAAGRRWSLAGDAGGAIEVDSTWIHLDPTGRPARLEGFGVYSAATGGRRASTRLTLPDPAPDAPRTPWQLRLVDADRMGHVNNAVFFAAVEERLPALGVDPRLPHRVLLEFRRPIDVGDAVELVDVVADGWSGTALAANGDVRAVARVDQS